MTNERTTLAELNSRRQYCFHCSNQIYFFESLDRVGTIIPGILPALKDLFTRAIRAALVVRRLAIITALATATATARRGGFGAIASQLTISSPRFSHVRGKGHAEILSVAYFFSLIGWKHAPPGHELAFFLGLFGKKLW